MDAHEIKSFEKHNQIREAKFLVGYNRSDSTCGWTGGRDAFKVYYSEFKIV